MKITRQSKYTFLIILISLTCSFDIFLNLTISGFSFRISQLVSMILILFWAINVLITQKIQLFIGSISLCIWSVCIIVFIPNTTFLTRNIGYAFWLILNALMIFGMVKFINEKNIKKILRQYLYSFAFIGIFGLLQFALGIIGIDPPFITQWWTPRLPRINGLSYEPSYYSTYLLTGWVLIFYLCIEKIKILKTIRKQYFLLFIITLAMVLSSSRMGILMMVLWIFRYVYLFLKYLGKGLIHKKYAIISFLGLITIISATLYFINDFSKVSFLLNGTGIEGTASHSIDGRSYNLQNTIEVFKEHPKIGVSLGGIAPAIGELHGVYVADQQTAKMFEGQTIFAEVLAASGIFAFIPFVIFILTIIIKPFKLAKKIPKENKNILNSLTWALIALLVILQFNQNILRVYLWFHIGLLCSAYNIYKKEFNISNKKRRKIRIVLDKQKKI